MFEHIGVEIQAGPGKRWGSHGDGYPYMSMILMIMWWN
ncbi:MAG: hypothetical protein CM1200mP15_11110 [Dehalococcoidia bacterium]|nr:MAG: hypothetical protein CM1200mP15_11110 [Dehalococcoidia bacterium]